MHDSRSNVVLLHELERSEICEEVLGAGESVPCTEPMEIEDRLLAVSYLRSIMFAQLFQFAECLLADDRSGVDDKDSRVENG